MRYRVDPLAIGGGIDGATIARDAAGRGLSVLTCEKGDLGEGRARVADDVAERPTRHGIGMTKDKKDALAGWPESARVAALDA